MRPKIWRANFGRLSVPDLVELDLWYCDECGYAASLPRYQPVCIGHGPMRRIQVREITTPVPSGVAEGEAANQTPAATPQEHEG
jgi:hypothetical protein